MVMSIFVAENPQLSYTTPKISVLELADYRKPLTSSLKTTYATPRQAWRPSTWRGSLAEWLSHTWLGPFH